MQLNPRGKMPGNGHFAAYKILRVMKLTAFFILIACLQVSAAAYSQQISLSEKNAPMTKVLNSIQEQSGYDFFYDIASLKEAGSVTIQVKNVTVKDALDRVFKDKPFIYTIKDKTITVQKKNPPTTTSAPQTQFNALPVTVSGKVTDELGNPMAGVTVKQKSSSANGTVTDGKGNYSLTVSNDNTVIVFSYIGYDTQELIAKDIVNGSNITLKPAPQNLQEVVISKGYYDEKRALSTGDVSVVTAKEIEEQPVTDPILTLEGRVPGLYISQTSGLPGAYSKIQIMGQNSILNGNDPLYIIDGVPFSSISLSSPLNGVGPYGYPSENGQNVSVQGNGQGLSPFNMLDPSEIENIEVLKDADATAIYGSRGANGVILITTKKGKAGDTRVSYKIEQGIGQMTRMMQMMNTQQYLQMREGALRNDGVAIPNIKADPYDYNYDIDGAWDTTKYTNWEKYFLGNTAHYTNANLSLAGGNTNTQFLMGGTFSRQGNVFPGDYADNKSSGFLNVTHHSTNQKFTAQLNIGYTYDKNNEPPLDLTSTAIQLPPDMPALYNKDGSLNFGLYDGTFTFRNPLSYEQQTFNATSNALISSLSLSYLLLPGLKIQANLGYNNAISNAVTLTPSSYYEPGTSNPSRLKNVTAETKSNNWSAEPQISYNKSIGRGELDALFGTSFQSQSVNDFAYTAHGFSDDAEIVDPSLASSLTFQNYSSIYRYNGVYGRLGYSWDEEFLLNVTARRDGSSRFGPDRQWGNFGAIGAGWVFSKAQAIKDAAPWISFGKIRASYGITGNDQIGDYQYLSTYTGNNNTYQGVTVLGPTGLTNAYYGWEHVKKLQIGLDLGIINDRINLTATWFRNRDDNQLIGFILPQITGFTSVEENSPASVQNSGWEFTLNTQNIKAKDFQWTTSFNLTLPQNKLLAFPNIENTSYATVYAVGHPLSVRFLYQYEGVSPQTGDYTYKTQNANGIPSYPNDLALSQPITQTAYGAFSNSFNYKHFELDVMFQFVKQQGYNYLTYWTAQPGELTNNQPVYFLNAWQQPGNHSNVGRYFEDYGNDYSAYNDLHNSTAMISDASFIRLKNVSLSYSLPPDLVKKATFQSARIYINAQNLLTITGYKGIDPETQSLGMPPLRMIALGLQGTF